MYFRSKKNRTYRKQRIQRSRKLLVNKIDILLNSSSDQTNRPAQRNVQGGFVLPPISCCGFCDSCGRFDLDRTVFRDFAFKLSMMVFVRPLYYYGMSAQLKTLIDRFCAINSSIQGKHMKSALLFTAWNGDDCTFDALDAHYQTLVRCLNLDDQGSVSGKGCGTPSMTRNSRYPQMAYALGRSLKQAKLFFMI